MTHIVSRNIQRRSTLMTIGAAAIACVVTVGCTSGDDPKLEIAATPSPSAQSMEMAPTDQPASNADITASDVEQSVQTPETLRQAESHVHGAANLAIALDSNTISIEFESPLYNLVGFEHQPETEAQKAAVENAQSVLSQPARLFQFNPESACEATSSETVTLMADDDHDHGHDHSQKDEHDHDHPHDDDHDHAHKDTLLSYSFTCGNPDRLEWVELGAFDAFDTLAEIALVYLGPSQQISRTLTPRSGRIQLID